MAALTKLAAHRPQFAAFPGERDQRETRDRVFIACAVTPDTPAAAVVPGRRRGENYGKTLVGSVSAARDVGWSKNTHIVYATKPV